MSRRRLVVALLVLIALAGCIGNGSQDQQQEPGEESENGLPDGFVAETVPYDTVSQVSAVNGTLTYVGHDDSGASLVHGGEVVAQASTIQAYRWDDGEWAYITGDEGSQHIHTNGEKNGPYDAVYPPVRIVESWAYGAVEDDTAKLFLKGIDVAQKYRLIAPDHTQYPVTAPSYTAVDDNLAYAAFSKHTDETIIVHDDSEKTRGTDVQPAVDSVNGRLIYVRDEAGESGSTETIVYGRKHISTGFASTRGYTGVNSSLYYIATGPQADETVFRFPEEESHGPYKVVTGITAVGDHPALAVQNDLGTRIIYRGRVHGQEYDQVDGSTVTGVGDTLAYRAERETGSVMQGTASVIVYGGQEIGETYDISTEIADIDGKLAAVAEKDGETYIIREQ